MNLFKRVYRFFSVGIWDLELGVVAAAALGVNTIRGAPGL